jgi:hypothetical protein
MKLLNIEITEEELNFINLVQEVSDEFQNKNPQPVYLLGLTQEQCAQLKEVFEKAKRFDISRKASLHETESLYLHIYLQIAANKNLLK